VTSLRSRYLDNADTEVDHRAYYGALVEHIGEEVLRRLLPVDKSPAEWQELVTEDEHLNNVPLRKWDEMDYMVRSLVRATPEHVAITGSKGWSLSDSVCVLKETAKRYAEVQS
jgi:hypothetical protein